MSLRLADGVLSGTYLRPDPCHAACVLIAGSGPPIVMAMPATKALGRCALLQKLSVSTASPASATTSAALQKVDSRRWRSKTAV